MVDSLSTVTITNFILGLGKALPLENKHLWGQELDIDLVSSDLNAEKDSWIFDKIFEILADDIRHFAALLC